uniref:Uncharacterized protein n=1 Tax=Anguilla anguilla TaxID=7936 RepID=A0A0E9WJ42_ANGAN
MQELNCLGVPSIVYSVKCLPSSRLVQPVSLFLIFAKKTTKKHFSGRNKYAFIGHFSMSHKFSSGWESKIWKVLIFSYISIPVNNIFSFCLNGRGPSAV